MEQLIGAAQEYFKNLFDVIRLADFFDIAIIAGLIYVILAWFKKTTSRFILIGIIILGLIYGLARFFELYLTEYVFHGFFAILLITLVIIFQEDLRRFFERVALWGTFRKRSTPLVSEEHINILTQVATSLAHKRHGALIVIRGDEYLDRHIEGGTVLDGKLSEALLESIFDPHSIGHDGAVIIENGSVARFGCHLPLSLNTGKLRNLGLRHTAALGLAERSDALCIVISEERGTIAVALHEKLIRLRSVEQLTPLLQIFYRKRSPKTTQKKWVRWVRENPWEKAIALILACSLWFAFGYQAESIRRDVIVPIEYRNLLTDWVIKEPKPKEASVSLTGSQQAFGLLDTKTLKLVLDLSELREGSQSFLLSRDLVRHPSNLSVVGIQPERIKLTAHKMVPVDIPVRIRTTGTIREGFVLSNTQADPTTVTVKALLKNKKSIRIFTEPIDLTSIVETATLTPKLVFPPNVQFMDDRAPEVKVTLTVKEQNSKAPKKAKTKKP